VQARTETLLLWVLGHPRRTLEFIAVWIEPRGCKCIANDVRRVWPEDKCTEDELPALVLDALVEIERYSLTSMCHVVQSPIRAVRNCKGLLPPRNPQLD
jgi:hypothetical protein